MKRQEQGQDAVEEGADAVGRDGSGQRGPPAAPAYHGRVAFYAPRMSSPSGRPVMPRSTRTATLSGRRPRPSLRPESRPGGRRRRRLRLTQDGHRGRPPVLRAVADDALGGDLPAVPARLEPLPPRAGPPLAPRPTP